MHFLPTLLAIWGVLVGSWCCKAGGVEVVLQARVKTPGKPQFRRKQTEVRNFHQLHEDVQRALLEEVQEGKIREIKSSQNV